MAKRTTPVLPLPAEAPTPPQGEGTPPEVMPERLTPEAWQQKADAAVERVERKLNEDPERRPLYFCPDPAEWDIDLILEHVCDGVRLKVIAKALGVTLSKLLAVLGRPENREAYEATKAMQGHAAVERMRQTIMEAKIGLIDPQVARLAVDSERWLAGKLNRDYAEKPAEVNINNITPLDALKALAQQQVPALPPMPVPLEPDTPAALSPPPTIQ